MMANQITPTGSLADLDILLAAYDITKYYGNSDGRREPILVLDHVSLKLRSGELVALLGPPGSGKSTFLRILAGLIAPSAGEVLVHGRRLYGPNPHVAMVFQSFALYPWLTVLQHFELGLLSTNLTPEERGAQA